MSNKNATAPTNNGCTDNNGTKMITAIINRAIGILESNGKGNEAIELCKLLDNDQRIIANLVHMGNFSEAERIAEQKNLENALAQAYEKSGHFSNAISAYIRCNRDDNAIRICEKTMQFDIAARICEELGRTDDANTYNIIDQSIKKSIKRRTL